MMLACAGMGAQAATVITGSSSIFAASTTGAVVGTFTDVPTPNCTGSACFGGGNPLAGYPSLQGVSFSTTNPGGSVNVNSAGFYGAGDLPVPYLVNSVFTATDPDNITITLPSPTTAFALDFGTLFSGTTADFTLSNGYAVDVGTSNTPFATQFLGLISTDPFDTITLTAPYNQSIVIEDFETATTVSLPVPEPATWTMLLFGLGGLGASLRTHRRRMVSVPFASS
jgi:hypothetical protein